MTLLKFIYGGIALFYLYVLIVGLMAGYSVFKLFLVIVGLVYFGGKFVDKLEESAKAR